MNVSVVSSFGTAEGGWQDSYGQINFTYDAATGILTYPDFTLVTADHNAGTTEVMIKVSNIKMTLTEAEEIVIPEIEGEWSFKPYSLGYVRNDSTFVYEFKMNLVAKDDTKKLYDATFNFEGFEPFTLEATFNGTDLVIPFNNQYLDAEKKINPVAIKMEKQIEKADETDSTVTQVTSANEDNVSGTTIEESTEKKKRTKTRKKKVDENDTIESEKEDEETNILLNLSTLGSIFYCFDTLP